MKNRKMKFAVMAFGLVFVLTAAGMFAPAPYKASDAVLSALITMLGSIILFYMGGNVGEHFAVSKREKKDAGNP